MKVINEGSQSKERAGASACPVIRRILKELYMHTCMPARKERHTEDGVRLLYASSVMQARSLFYIQLQFSYESAKSFPLTIRHDENPFNFDDHRLVSLSRSKAV